jgi:DNA-binding NarL/FixJ family response regulator
MRNKPAGQRRVLLLEDPNRAGETLESALPRIGLAAVTERAVSEPDLTQKLRNFAPDVVLSDPGLEPLPTAAALKVMQSERSITPLIMVANDLDDHTAVACLRAGAEDLVLKGNLDRLAASIETALTVRQPLKKLSPRQLEVLRLVTEGRTTKEIAERLNLSVKTVESHRGELTRRLGIKDVAGLVQYAVRVGLTPLSCLSCLPAAN